jgi:hypothetical protein
MSAGSPCKRSGETPEQGVGLVHDIAICELILLEPGVNERVYPGGGVCELLCDAVVPMASDLDDGVGRRKSEVNADDSLPGSNPSNSWRATSVGLPRPGNAAPDVEDSAVSCAGGPVRAPGRQSRCGCRSALFVVWASCKPERGRFCPDKINLDR